VKINAAYLLSEDQLLTCANSRTGVHKQNQIKGKGGEKRGPGGSDSNLYRFQSILVVRRREKKEIRTFLKVIKKKIVIQSKDPNVVRQRKFGGGKPTKTAHPGWSGE